MATREELQHLAREHGTPLFVVDHEVLRRIIANSSGICRACRPIMR